MTNLPWPIESLDRAEQYANDAIRWQLKTLFGTENPVVWITGSASDRVGRAVAKRFAMHGYRIVLHGNQSIEQAEEVAKHWTELGIETFVTQSNVQDERQVKSCVDQIIDRFGRLDVLVHTAAVWNPKALEQTFAQNVLEQFAVNSLGSFLCAKYAGLAMVSQPTGGSMILTGDWAIARPYKDFGAYFISKGSLPTMTRTFAVELAERNPKVRVNAIMPGPVMLPEGTSQTKIDAVVNQSLLRMNGAADHVARAALFLAEHEFLTGVCLPVDGGRTIYAGNHSDAVAHPDLD